MSRSTLRATLLFAAIAVVLLGPRTFVSELPVYRDLMVLFVPLRAWLANAAARSESLLWCPDLFFGAPFLANYQSAVFYPPSLLFHVLPLPTAVGLYLAFHLAMAGVGVHRLLIRTHGRTEIAALLGGLTFALGGFFVSLLSLTNQLAAAAWLPWVLLRADALATHRDLRTLATLALALCLPALAGAPETVLLTGALAVVVAVSRSTSLRTAGVAATLVFVAGILAALATAVQLLPTFEYYLETQRSAGLALADVSRESLTLRSFEQLFLPPTFADGAPRLYPEGGVPLVASLYVGIAPLVFALAVVFSGGLWVWIALASALFASAAATPLLGAAHSFAPQLAGAFRYPVKLFLPAHLALAILAAHGCDRAFEAGFARRIVAIAIGGALLGFGVLLAGSAAPGQLLASLGYELRPGLSVGIAEVLAAPLVGLGARLLGLAAIVGFLVAAAVRGWIGARIASAALLVVTAVDLLAVHQGTIVTIEERELRTSVTPEALGMRPGDRIFHYCTSGFGCLSSNEPGLGAWAGSVRALEPVAPRARRLWRALVPDIPFLYDLAAVAGSDGFVTRTQRDFYTALAHLPRDRSVHLLRSLGVRWLIGLQPLDVEGLDLRHVDPDSGAHFYEIRGAAPRMYVTSRTVPASSTPLALARVSAADFLPGAAVAVAGPVVTSDGGDAGVVQGVTAESTRIRAVVRAERDSWWVVNDSFFPGWVATLDGRETSIERVNGIVRGVRVPVGRHDVEMRYQPTSVHQGALVSLVTIAALGLAAILPRRTRLARVVK